jgi:hypothetical protein
MESKNKPGVYGVGEEGEEEGDEASTKTCRLQNQTATA